VVINPLKPGGRLFPHICFYHWANISTLKGEFIGGAIIGLFVALIFDLSFVSMWNLYNAKSLVVDILIAGLMYGFEGAAIGWILGFKSKTD
jgi:hypothetical protein